MRLFTYRQRPDLAARTGEIEDTFPELVAHDEAIVRHWHRLRQELPELQLVLWDERSDVLVGHARTLPVRQAEGLPGSIGEMLEAWFGDGPRPEPDVLSAMVAVVDRGHQGRGLSRLLLEGMREIAGRAGFGTLIAPVRPNWKERYPLMPIERYAAWTREDGLPFDPWLRVHARLGAEFLQICWESMRVEGSVADWESWTGMRFPFDGDYVVPGALVPVRFAGGRGVYVEPNFWMRHRAALQAGRGAAGAGLS